MTALDIHPEDLLDKLTRGQLSDSERSHLETHLKGCAVCRLELELRADFEREAADIDVSHLPSPRLTRTNPSPAKPVRRTSRRWIWGFAVAGLVTATGAVAAVVTHRIPWPAQWRPSRAEASAPAAPRRAPIANPRTPGRTQVGPAAAEQQPSLPEASSQPQTRPARPAVVSPRKVESLGRAASGDDPARSPSTLFAAANLARRRGNLGEATRLYQDLQSKFPNSGEAKLSWVICARLELDSGRAASALQSFDRYLTAGRGALEAEALVGRATALRRLGRHAEEASMWQRVASKYPGSAYAQQAAERLAALESSP